MLLILKSNVFLIIAETIQLFYFTRLNYVSKASIGMILINPALVSGIQRTILNRIMTLIIHHLVFSIFFVGSQILMSICMIMEAEK